MKITVSDLEGEQAAEFAAISRGWSREVNKQHQSQYRWRDSKGNDMGRVDSYRPDINDVQAMELAEKFGLQVDFERKMAWRERSMFGFKGETVRIAITRAAIASVFGEIVTVEDENETNKSIRP